MNVRSFMIGQAQYIIVAALALLTLYISQVIKSYGYSEAWFKTKLMGFDSFIIWACLMGALSKPVTVLFRYLFGDKNSII